MPGLLRRFGQVGMVGLLWLGVAAAAPACPFCNAQGQGQTLTGEVTQASMVLYGTLTNARPERDGAPDGTTDLIIDSVIKPHAWLEKHAQGKILTLPRYVLLPVEEPAGKSKSKFLVFCDIFKDKLDPYRGVAVKSDSDIPKYLKGAMALKDEKPTKRLKFFFDYLDNSDSEISNDAYREFANSDYKDYKDVAATMSAADAERVARWLTDRNTPTFRFGLYASMLGHAGKGGKAREYADLLRGMLEKPEVRIGSGVDGILAGYILLQPGEAMEFFKSIVGNSSKEFLYRYSALKAARFFWSDRPDVVGHKKLAEALSPLLQMGDIGDLLIEDFRKWQAWEMTEPILGLQNYPVYNKALIKRSIIRYALSAEKHNEPARKYIETLRKKEAKLVNDVEELLKSGS